MRHSRFGRNCYILLQRGSDMNQEVILSYDGEEYTMVVSSVEHNEQLNQYILRGADPYVYPSEFSSEGVAKFLSGGMAVGPDGVDKNKWPACIIDAESPVSVTSVTGTDKAVSEPDIPPSY